jgi:LmbE family N-acetylglucosaminyl deacetylase
MGRLPAAALLGCALSAAGAAGQAVPPTPSPAAIAQGLRSFRECATVLYVAAHPDDENTQLIAYLARGRDYRTAYLSLTRGDGGQNALGPEFGDLLGVIRTQELLAARRADGGRQFFSRARDFGYSKDYLQTLGKWDRQQVLADVVRVIRTFRPDVVITRFPIEPGGTHGHHTASAVLALEAFRLAGDPRAFPDQLGSLSPWQPKRILWNSYGSTFGGPADNAAGVIHLPIDGTDPVSGASFAVLAARSRSMHQTQGFANFSVAAGGGGPRVESFRLLAGDPASGDMMDGVDTTWARYPGGAPVAAMAGRAVASFDASDPAASVPALLEIRRCLAALARDEILDEKLALLDSLIADCLGLRVATAASEGEIVPGERVSLRSTAVTGSPVPVEWRLVRYPGLHARKRVGRALARDAESSVSAEPVLPADTPLTQPYWLRAPETPGMFRVEDTSLIGSPESAPPLPVEYIFKVGGQEITLRGEALYAEPGPKGAARRPFVIPPVSLRFPLAVRLFAPGSTRDVEVEVTASRPGSSGTIALQAPPGWSASPASYPFRLRASGESSLFRFSVGAPASPGTADIGAVAVVGGVRFDTSRTEIRYGHIPPQLLQPRAEIKAVCADVAIRGASVGYLPGAGDSTAAALEQMGYAVRVLADADVTADGMRGLDAVVVGVRAFNSRPALAKALPALFAFAEAGGTVVEEYHTPSGLQSIRIAPYDMAISRDLPKFRVTDEKSAVTLLDPADPALTAPNRIGPADFTGWVQERGLDFASSWDQARFKPLLATSDPGEAPLRGGLLVARVGRGYFVYTGLSFFRQFPAGVSGAYRLFANLVSLGK